MACLVRAWLLLLCLALLHVSAQSIRPLTEAALVLSSAQPGGRNLLSLVSEYRFEPEVETALESSSQERRSLKKTKPASVATPPPPSPPAATAPAKDPGVHTDYVYQGY